MENVKKEYVSEYVNCIIPKLNERDFVHLDLHIKAQEFADFVTKHKQHIEQSNGFVSLSIFKALKDPNKLYTKFTKLVEVKEDVVTHKEQMPDRDDLPF